jgi:uncharacterized protein
MLNLYEKNRNIKKIKLKNSFLFINPDSGKWVIGDQDVNKVISVLKQPQNINDLIKNLKMKVDKKIISKLIDELCKNDIIFKKEESCRMENLFEGREINPKLVILNLTYQCNLSCSYCYTSSNPYLKDHMDEELALKIISEVYYLPRNLYNNTSNRRLRIAFHGGEPLLKFSMIKKIIEKLRKMDFFNNLSFTVQTNGTLINSEMVKFFKENEIHVGISLDGPAELNNRTRFNGKKRGSFDKAYKALNLLRQYGVPFGVITVLSKKNINDIDKIIEFFLKENIKGITLNYFVPFGRGRHFKNELEISQAQLYRAYKEILELFVNYPKDEKDEKSVPFKELTLKSLLLNLKGIYTNMCLISPCGAVFDQLSFDPQGNVFPCDDFSPFPEFILGNINKLSLKEIILRSNIVKMLRERTVENISCKKCVWKSICGGGCPAKSYLKYGHIYHKHPYCSFMKKIILELFYMIEENKIDFFYEHEI